VFLQLLGKKSSANSIFENENESESENEESSNGNQKYFSNTLQISSLISPEVTAQLLQTGDIKIVSKNSTSFYSEKLHGSERVNTNFMAPHIFTPTSLQTGNHKFSIEYSKSIPEKEFLTTSNLIGDNNPETSNLLKPFKKKKTLKKKSLKTSITEKKNYKRIDTYKSSNNKKLTYEEFIKYPLFRFEFEKMKNFSRFCLENNVETVIKMQN
jgi:hypothetical protein